MLASKTRVLPSHWSTIFCDIRASAGIALCSQLADAPRTQPPPPDTARRATADLCDVHYLDPVDKVVQPEIRIMQPIFRDFGGNMRFSGQAATVKCFENNPLVRKAGYALTNAWSLKMMSGISYTDSYEATSAVVIQTMLY